jgi:hypothetical protein
MPRSSSLIGHPEREFLRVTLGEGNYTRGRETAPMRRSVLAGVRGRAKNRSG